MNRDVRILIHDVRSMHNVGSLFRTSDALGATHVYLSGYTPAPIDRFGRPVKDIAKTALGAERTLAWSSHKSPQEVIEHCKKEGFTIVAIEQDERALDYKTYMAPEKVLVLVGSEIDGLAEDLRRACDILVEIPMKGAKESLNVSVAFGIALYRILGL